MKNFGRQAALWMATGAILLVAACGGGGSSSGGSNNPPPVTTYVLTVNSATPASGVTITASPKDNNNTGSGSTNFTLTYNAGSSITLTAPATAGSNKFSSWTGCTTASTVTCTVTLNANTTVTATYTAPAVSSVTVTPNPATAVIGATLQFSAAVAGPAVTDSTVTWSITAPTGSTLSPGTMTKTGLYTSPYPAPATVTVTATSNQDTTVSGAVTMTLNAPATVAGPALTVDAGNPTHAISPDIYGMNYYTISAAAAKAVSLPVDRWGGDATSRYNYVLDVTSSASDWYFENQAGLPGGTTDASSFNAQVAFDATVGAKTLATVPVLGWVAKDATSCSFPTATYPNQQKLAPDRACGNGVYANGVNNCTNSNGCNVTGNDPTLTSTAVDATWSKNWVNFLVGKYGAAAKGGVAIYDLDNEPSWWDAVHRDVHPAPFTYDEVTNNGLATALAIKTADPTAEVSGPVMDYWWAYFYSKKDIEAGWGAAPCYQPWGNPADRNAHGGTPLIEYYLKQFAAYEAAHSVRLLDYLDLHTYFAAQYPINSYNSVGLTTAGDTAEQQLRLNSTRAFWDPTYTDPNTGSSQQFPQPNYPTDSNYTTDCTKALTPQAPQAIPMMRNWVAKDYPGTKLAITEYNWGGQENVNGAVAQADILGIFGREGLDLGTLWGPPDPTTQVPGLMAFEIYRNYDGKNAMFGDTAVQSTSADQGKLSVYGALRKSDNTITIVIVNKTYGDLTSTLSLDNLAAATTSAHAFLYSNANLAAIVAQPAVTVTAPTGGGTTSTITTTFPAQSITLLVIPN